MSGREGMEGALAEAFSGLGRPGSFGDELSDDELLAGLFDPDERAALEAHAAALETADSELIEAERVEGGQVDETSEAATGRAVGGRISWLAAMVVCVLALGALAVVLGSHELGSDAGARSQVATPATGAAMTSAHERPVSWAHPGERHELGRDDCRRVAEDVRLCSPQTASFRVGEGSSATAIELELESGTLELEGSGAAIELRTAAGRVIQREGVGRFRVSFDREHRRLLIEVIRGEVELEARDGERVTLGAGAHLGVEVGVVSPDFADPVAIVEAGSEAAENAEPVETAKSAVTKAGRAPEPETPDALLAAAQRELAGGRRQDALRLYRRLIDLHPDSEAGRTARVSLGRMLLAGGEHRGALAEFDAYLGARGKQPLAEEARYGRIRCLRALDRGDELAEAIADFQARHPASLHRDRLARWQGELEGAGDEP
ncbi:MAG: tetratricopeptide repeat protein [Myxococcales bacterium]|nr:tetratricopeptide repeat protein [Myxococcales bacterium]